jgi:hypothetical protein
MSKRDQLNEIAISARVLAQAFPDNARRYRKVAQAIKEVKMTLRETRVDDANTQFLRGPLRLQKSA